MSIEGKFSSVELPKVCWHVVGNEVMARFGVLVMQYLLVTKITYHPLVGEMLMNIYRYIYSYPLWWISVSSEILALSWLKTIHETFRLSYGINAERDYRTLLWLIEHFVWDFLHWSRYLNTRRIRICQPLVVIFLGKIYDVCNFLSLRIYLPSYFEEIKFLEKHLFHKPNFWRNWLHVSFDCIPINFELAGKGGKDVL